MTFVSSWLLAIFILLVLLVVAVLRVGKRAPLRSIWFGGVAISGLVGLLTLENLFQDIWGKSVQLKVSVVSFWPAYPSVFNGQNDATAKYAAGGFSTGNIEVNGLSIGVRLLLAGATVLAGAVVICISLLISNIAKQLDSGIPFRKAIGAKAAVAGWVVLFAGIGSSLLELIANNLGQMEVFGVHRGFGANADSTVPNPWLTGQGFDFYRVLGALMPSPQFAIELWPIFVAVGLLLTSKVLTRAEYLEKELGGLV